MGLTKEFINAGKRARDPIDWGVRLLHPINNGLVPQTVQQAAELASIELQQAGQFATTPGLNAA